MRISIFNLKNKTSYKEEYNKFIKVLNNKCLSFKNKNYNYFDFINTYIFTNWKYRSTFLDVYEYLEFIGIKITNKKISLDNFINFIEFILNMQILIESIKYYNDNIIYNPKANSIIFHNIPIILDELGYQAYDLDDKVIIYKKDIIYTDLLEDTNNNISELLLSYNSINNTGIKTKRIILNKLYIYLMKEEKIYQKIDSNILNTVKTVINEMGVIGDIKDKYKSLTNYKLRKYYDYCFRLICFLINSKYIYKVHNKVKNSL